MNIHKEYLKNKKERKKLVLILVLMITLFLVFYADNLQQKRFDSLSQAYENVRNQEYTEALEKFENYLNIDSRIYWYLNDCINDYSYSRQGVINARNECIQKMNR